MTRRRKWFIIAAVGVVSTLVVLSVILSNAVVLGEQTQFEEPGFDGLANWVNLHARSRDPSVKLPPQYADLSISGRAYITSNYVFVPTWMGRRTLLPDPINNYDRDCGGYLFAKRKLITYDMGDLEGVTIYVPNFSGLVGIDRPHGAIKAQMMVSHWNGAPHWYFVEAPPVSILDDRDSD